MNIAILGAGALGTALAVSLAGRHRVALCAHEAARRRLAALTFAAHDAQSGRRTEKELRHPTRRVYFSTDLAGVEISGAVKGVMAIAAGISDGLGLGLNARAALITRGLAELTRLGLALGGRAQNLLGPPGAGGLLLARTREPVRQRQNLPRWQRQCQCEPPLHR